ncbi:MAG: ACP phosphodiesterase [Bacteroidota bacterium]
MNYLAHVYLSYENEEILAGNLMADFIKGKPDTSLPDGIIRGITLHRIIDSYTDQHPVVLESKKSLYPVFGKYAPVVLDVFYDHILANDWLTYSNKSLKAFTQRNYKLMNAQIEWMPEILQLRLPSMINHDWLSGYKTIGGITRSFDRLRARVSKPEKLKDAPQFLFENMEYLSKGFNQFFPDVEQLAQEFIESDQ